MNDSAPTPIPLRIRLPYGSEDEFIERYGTNVARGGIFIATRSIKAEGTLLQFEFILADGSRLLRGEGVVVKAQVDEGGNRAGMTLRFTRLDARSKLLVDKVIARRSGVPEAEQPDAGAVVSAEPRPPQPHGGAHEESPASVQQHAPVPASSQDATGEATSDAAPHGRRSSAQPGIRRNGTDAPASSPASSQSGVHRNGADSPAPSPVSSQSGVHRN
ncbi:MAG: TIGR02266 family protein, partial [Myxococcaceae bacterium]|nr:TIGR02266 family protein [Myxococcaceae bacterium]